MHAPSASAVSQGAVIATRPASEALRHMETSGFPNLIHVKIIVVTVAIAGAMVVATKMLPSCSSEVAAAPLNPYQPSQRMNTPKAPIGMLWPGNALTFVTLPFSSLMNLPIRGPKIAAPIRAEIPPTMWMQLEPAKSWKPICASHPPPHVQ